MAVLNAAARNALPASKFALPGQGAGPQGKGSGSFPINDRKRAIAAKALERFAPPGKQAQITSKANAVLGKKKVTKAPPKPVQKAPSAAARLAGGSPVKDNLPY